MTSKEVMVQLFEERNNIVPVLQFWKAYEGVKASKSQSGKHGTMEK